MGLLYSKLLKGGVYGIAAATKLRDGPLLSKRRDGPLRGTAEALVRNQSMAGFKV